MSRNHEKEKLGLERWHKPLVGNVNSYVDTFEGTSGAGGNVLLALMHTSKSPDLYELTADDAEMLGMRLIAAARMYRGQEREEADDE